VAGSEILFLVASVYLTRNSPLLPLLLRRAPIIISVSVVNFVHLDKLGNDDSDSTLALVVALVKPKLRLALVKLRLVVESSAFRLRVWPSKQCKLKLEV
jgi:hypothetical protein